MSQSPGTPTTIHDLLDSSIISIAFTIWLNQHQGLSVSHLTVNDDSEAKQVFAEPNLVFNMSVWESQQALREFVYKSEHASILRQRADWFVPMNRPVFAL